MIVGGRVPTNLKRYHLLGERSRLLLPSGWRRPLPVAKIRHSFLKCNRRNEAEKRLGSIRIVAGCPVLYVKAEAK